MEFTQPDKDTVASDIIHYLKTNQAKGLTVRESVSLGFGTELRKRLSDLKKYEGYQFTEVWKENSGGKGRHKRWYFLADPTPGFISLPKPEKAQKVEPPKAEQVNPQEIEPENNYSIELFPEPKNLTAEEVLKLIALKSVIKHGDLLIHGDAIAKVYCDGYSITMDLFSLPNTPVYKTEK